jgi:inner membrane protein involved in colicin E2 resistance
MKKILLFLVLSLVILGCQKAQTVQTAPNLSVEEQTAVDVRENNLIIFPKEVMLTENESVKTIPFEIDNYKNYTLDYTIDIEFLKAEANNKDVPLNDVSKPEIVISLNHGRILPLEKKKFSITIEKGNAPKGSIFTAKIVIKDLNRGNVYENNRSEKTFVIEAE